MLLLATVALTGCRFAEHGRRAAIDAFASFVLDSVSQAPLTQVAPAKHASPAPRAAVAPARTQACSATVAVVAPAPAPAADPVVLPQPQPRVASIELAPAVTVRIPRMNVNVKQIVFCSDVARAQVEARMKLAEIRGTAFPQRGARRVVVVLPEIFVAEPPPAPATL